MLTADWPIRHSGVAADDGKPQRLAMVRAELSRWWSTWDTMTIRSAAMGTIALTIVLSALIALSAMFARDINERNIDIVKTVLLSFGGLLTGLLIFLRLETLSGKADEAAVKAAIAAEKAAAVEVKVEAAHHDMLNGGMRENIKRAYAEIEDDPVILARRIELAALGVQKDRHELKNRRAAERMRPQLEARGMPKRTEPAD